MPAMAYAIRQFALMFRSARYYSQLNGAFVPNNPLLELQSELLPGLPPALPELRSQGQLRR